MPTVRKNQTRLDSIQRDPSCSFCGKKMQGAFYGKTPACSAYCSFAALRRLFLDQGMKATAKEVSIRATLHPEVRRDSRFQNKLGLHGPTGTE